MTNKPQILPIDAGGTGVATGAILGTVGTTDNRIPRANGTGGSTLQASSVAIDDSGYILAQDGAFGTPSYSFDSDPDTGFYRDGVNSLAALAGGGLIWSANTTTYQMYKILRLQSGLNFTLTESSGSPVATTADVIIGITSTAAARTVTLPDTANSGAVFIVKDESGAAATNNITVSVSGGVKTIDGSTSFVINTNYGVLRCYYNGTNFFTF